MNFQKQIQKYRISFINCAGRILRWTGPAGFHVEPGGVHFISELSRADSALRCAGRISVKPGEAYFIQFGWILRWTAPARFHAQPG